jgi:glycosyltransferase involved in cell wall biosynthesis
VNKAKQNVLLIAFGCEPGRGSEAGIGWRHAIAIARTRPVWIVTHPRHRAPLEEGIDAWNQSGQGQPIHATYVNVPSPGDRLEHLGYFGFNLYYYAWIRVVAKRLQELHRRIGFNVSQHVSLVRWWMPSPAMSLVKHGVPFVWGPLGAGETMPRAFRGGIGMKAHLTEWTRAIARDVFRLDPALERCARLASFGVAEPGETVTRLQALGVGHIDRAMSQPCDLDRMTDIKPVPKGPGTFRIVSGGAAIYWKTLHLSIEAFARAFRGRASVEYVHVCGGNQLPKLRRLAERLGVADQVNLVGEIPHEETLRWVKSADVYTVPAMRDTGAHLLEALSCGTPCVVAGHYSAAAVVDETCGFAIEVDRPEPFMDRMAAAFRSLHADPSLHRELAAGARLRAKELSTDAYAANLDRLHTQAIAAVVDAPPQPAEQTLPSIPMMRRAS